MHQYNVNKKNNNINNYTKAACIKKEHIQLIGSNGFELSSPGKEANEERIQRAIYSSQ